MARSSRNRAETVLDALGNPIRRRIVRILAERPRPVGEIASKLPISRPAVSKHLRMLQRAHLVVYDREGNRNVFRLDPDGFDAARSWLAAFWDEALANFKELAEEKS